MFNKSFQNVYLGNNSHIDISCMQAIFVAISAPYKLALCFVCFLFLNQ